MQNRQASAVGNCIIFSAVYFESVYKTIIESLREDQVRLMIIYFHIFKGHVLPLSMKIYHVDVCIEPK